jgi:transcription initiation factor TFIIB
MQNNNNSSLSLQHYENTYNLNLRHDKNENCNDDNNDLIYPTCSCNGVKLPTITIYDPEKGEIVCSNCGVVIHDNIETIEPERGRLYYSSQIGGNNKNIRPGMHFSLAIHDKGLSTVISHSNVDAYGTTISPEQIGKLRRMRHWNKISSYNDNNGRNHARNLTNAFVIMYKVKDKLSLTDSVVERSAYIYRKALAKHLIKGRSIDSIAIASIYAACRELDVPRTLEEISETANTDPAFAAKCYRLLLRHLRINYLPGVDSNVYLSKAASRAKVSEKTYRKALEMLAKVKESHISSGKNPNAVAVAVLYAACLKECEKISQTQIALAGNMSVVTLRKRLSDVRSIFLE